MPSHDRRAAARRKAWGRGPMILRFEPLEGRQVLSGFTNPFGSTGTTTAPEVTGTKLGPEVVATAFDTLHTLDYGDPFRAVGAVQNHGDAPTPQPLLLDVYASPGQKVAAGSVFVGSIMVPAGLQPGETYSFNQPMYAPPMPLSGLSTGASYYFNLVVDADHRVNDVNDPATKQAGPSSLVTVQPKFDSNLVPVTFSVSAPSLTWGESVNVAATIKNDALGSAPATRARVVLRSPGAPDLTVGDLQVPAIPGFATAGVSGKITLPARPPASLAGASELSVVLIPDADYVTRPYLSTPTPLGKGIDSQTVAITPGTAAELTTLPDITVASLKTPSDRLVWGSDFQVTAKIENDGKTDAGPFTARFYLVDDNRPGNPPLALADAQIPGLKAGYAQDVTQTLSLHGKLPAGVTPEQMSGRIVVQLDPENRLVATNTADDAFSVGGVKLKLVTRDGFTADPTDTTTTTPPSPTGGVPQSNRKPISGGVQVGGTTTSTPTTGATVTQNPATPKRRRVSHVGQGNKPKSPQLRVFRGNVPKLVRSRRQSS